MTHEYTHICNDGNVYHSEALKPMGIVSGIVDTQYYVIVVWPRSPAMATK